MTRVVWTNAEKAEVFEQLAEVFRRNPTLPRKTAFTDAQSVLRYDRRIKVTDQRVFNYKARIDAAWNAAMSELQKKPPKALVAPAPISAPPPAPERKESTTERLAQAFERLLDIMADAVAAKVADRLAGQILENAPQMVTTPRPKHDPRPIPHATGYAKPGVLVIGLLPAQAHQVSHMLADRLDLSFFTAEDAVTYPKLTRAHTVLMTKFISHAVQDKYRKATNLHFCNGGTNELMKILDSIVAPVL